MTFAPGDLVRARGREWVVLPSPSPDVLRLRPLSGAESDVQVLRPALERRPVEPARFGVPATELVANQDSARLLSDALRLSLRRGAGPFRSAARVAVEPRAYQLVPLLMALRLPVVRLLVADDVGIGKTIEAGLILREMLDRGEVDRFAILCPPHLVDQWTRELRDRFDLDATAVTAASAGRLERGLPVSQTLFDAHPFTVVSLDYIKAESRRASFARVCPPFVIVDEAHACVGGERGKHQRFGLLQALSADPARHMLLLTATPHSGDPAAFGRLLGLIDPSFVSSADFSSEAGRIQLARHIVQRRRIDVTGPDWTEESAFARHESADLAYRFDAATRAFHDAVLDWCLGVVAGMDMRAARLAFWGVLALMRCVGSSPAAAAAALRNRIAGNTDNLSDAVLDEDDADTDANDLSPAPNLNVSTLKDEDPNLAALAAQADQLAASADPKLQALVDALRAPIAAGANPVVFCRYLATAAHVADGLRRAYPGLRIDSVTGALPPEERKVRVEALGEAEDEVGPPQRLLVATDCLSEGVNLQALFDMVVHYDLSWNPTRHQQREGRVDRFGQPSRLVRSLLMFSPDSAIDGAVLEVILRKAAVIRSSTGVVLPLPDERGAVSGALMRRVLLRRGARQQLSLNLGLEADDARMEVLWTDMAEGERRSRTRFAQNAIRPADVAPEWQRWRAMFGGPDEVRRFVADAVHMGGGALEARRNTSAELDLSRLPDGLRELLEGRGMSVRLRLAFGAAVPSAITVARNHPLVSILADGVLEAALDPSALAPSSRTMAPIGRVGAWISPAVTRLTTVVLLRLRFKLTISLSQGRGERLLLAEEAQAAALVGDTLAMSCDPARLLLDEPASGDLASAARTRLLDQLAERLQTGLSGPLAAFAAERASVLAEDHERVRGADQRRAIGSAERVKVEAVLPPDVIGAYVLVPRI